MNVGRDLAGIWVLDDFWKFRRMLLLNKVALRTQRDSACWLLSRSKLWLRDTKLIVRI